MYELLGISLALAALLTLNTVASLFAAMLWRALRSRAGRWSARVRAQLLFALRVFPSISAVICVIVLLVPAYIANEPRDRVEAVSWKLGFLAAISAVGLSLAIWRGVAAWMITRRLITSWLENAEPIHAHGIAIPAYRFRHHFPVIAVVGAIRPRLFIADYLFDSLSQEELAAAIAHECGHLKAHDNLKRAILRACRDALSIVPCGRSLDRAWSEASEAAADEYAARAGALAALDLATALVKIARLVPQGIKRAIPAGALLIGEDSSGITYRVKRLTEIAAQAKPEEARLTAGRVLLWLSLSFWLTAGFLLFLAPNLLASVHQLIEAAVSTLQ